MTQAKVTIHKQTKMFIDIEANKKQVWLDCSDFPAAKNSFIGFYIFDTDTAYFFYYRRPLGIKQCHEAVKEYQKMINNSEGVRIVGITPDEENIPAKKYPNSNTPERFFKAKKRIYSVFVRLQANNKCKAYFDNDCELPANYWGGVIPE